MSCVGGWVSSVVEHILSIYAGGHQKKKKKGGEKHVIRNVSKDTGKRILGLEGTELQIKIAEARHGAHL
jgi:hypothetical protein